MPRRRLPDESSSPPVTRQSTSNQRRDRLALEVVDAPIFYETIDASETIDIAPSSSVVVAREALLARSPLIFSALCDDPKTRLQCAHSSQQSPSTSTGVSRKRRRAQAADAVTGAPSGVADEGAPPRTRSRLSSSSRQSPGTSHGSRRTNAGRPSTSTDRPPSCRPTSARRPADCPRVVPVDTTAPPVVTPTTSTADGLRSLERQLQQHVAELASRHQHYAQPAQHYYQPVTLADGAGGYYTLMPPPAVHVPMTAETRPTTHHHHASMPLYHRAPVDAALYNERQAQAMQLHQAQLASYHQLQYHHHQHMMHSSLHQLLFDGRRGHSTTFPPHLVHYAHVGSLLEQLHGKTPRGMTRAQIDALPAHRWTGEEGVSCVVCMSDLVGKELVKALHCTHTYHKRCIDKWLKANRSCPVCRRDASKTEVRPA